MPEKNGNGNTREMYEKIHIGKIVLDANLVIPEPCFGIVIFAHGSGSSRFSPRNQHIAKALQNSKFATLLFDLLTKEEGEIDDLTRQLRFDIRLLSERMLGATDWVRKNKMTANMKIGYFGASTGVAAALEAAAHSPENIKAIVSRGGRPDLAGPHLSKIKAPTLLIVGGNDPEVIELNRLAQSKLTVKNELVIVPGATHLFEEKGKLEEVAELAKNWFVVYLGEEVIKIPDEIRSTK